MSLQLLTELNTVLKNTGSFSNLILEKIEAVDADREDFELQCRLDDSGLFYLNIAIVAGHVCYSGFTDEEDPYGNTSMLMIRQGERARDLGSRLLSRLHEEAEFQVRREKAELAFLSL